MLTRWALNLQSHFLSLEILLILSSIFRSESHALCLPCVLPEPQWNRYNLGARDDFHMARAMNTHVYAMRYIHSPHRQDIPITYTNISKLLKDSITGRSLWFLSNYYSWFLRRRRVEGSLDFSVRLCQHGCGLPLKGRAYCSQALASFCRFDSLGYEQSLDLVHGLLQVFSKAVCEKCLRRYKEQCGFK